MTYDNRSRREAALTTRARVIQAANACFLGQGFGGTTIRQIAAGAGVSQETIYKTFGGKAALLKSVYDTTLVGDDENLSLARRPEAVAVRGAQSPAAAASAYAELVQVISRRIDPLLRVVLGAHQTDPELAEFARTIDRERRTGSSLYVHHWHEAGWLRPGISVNYAIDTVWALNSPQPRWLLLDQGWSDTDYTRWLAALICSAIFASGEPG